MKDIIVGIDLGTTNSAVAVVENGQPRILAKGKDKLIPSVVGYSAQSGWLVGHPALNQYTLDPENTIRSIKRKIGTTEKIIAGGREFSPQEISAMILRELKQIAEDNLKQPVNKAVITVPAFFTNAQRQATKESGEIAGLEVVRIINEPTAAALAYGLDHESDDVTLVYDLGGGTFDVSIVDMSSGVVDVRASHGDTNLGGDDFDERLSEHFMKEFNDTHSFSLEGNRKALARLNRAAEATKVKLSNHPETVLREEYLAEKNNIPLHLETEVERIKFVDLIDDLLNRTIESIDKVLKDAELDIEDLDRVLLVGGSTRIPAVWSIVSDYTGIEPASEINPDEAVALGAAIQGAIISGEDVGSILVDVTPYSLGIATAVVIGGRLISDQYSMLIHRNTTVPVTKEETFYAISPDQESIEIKVYQGEEPIASDNTLLGRFTIGDLEAPTRGDVPSINVRFDFDANGMLHVRVTDRETGKTKEKSVQATQARLSPADIAKARTGLDRLRSDRPILVLSDETKALVRRSLKLLEDGSLEETDATNLRELLSDIDDAQTEGDQTELDELAEELLDVLFELE